MTDICGCSRCQSEQTKYENLPIIGSGVPLMLKKGWRYACEICGNKRCPHHEDHEFMCTNSNEPGQVGRRMELSNEI